MGARQGGLFEHPLARDCRLLIVPFCFLHTEPSRWPYSIEKRLCRSFSSCALALFAEEVATAEIICHELEIVQTVVLAFSR